MGAIRDNIAANITFHRKRLKLSQKELAEKVGVKSVTTVSSWERGANAPDVETLFKLCDLFGISVDAMYGNSQEKKIVQYLRFIDYLKSLGYVVEDKVTKWHYGEIVDDFNNREQIIDEIIYTVQKDKRQTTYTADEFKKFEETVVKTIEFQIWDKSNQQ